MKNENIDFNEFKLRFKNIFHDDVRYFDAPIGWKKIIENFCIELDETNKLMGCFFKINNIKTKFGDPRIWVDSEYRFDQDQINKINKLCDKYEKELKGVCFFCGSSVNLNFSNYRRLCKNCYLIADIIE